MNGLHNPYQAGPHLARADPTGRVPAAVTRAAALALLGAGVASGCSTPSEGPETPNRPTMPVPSTTPTPDAPTSASPAPDPTTGEVPEADVLPEAGTPRPAQLTKPGADYTVVRGDTLSELASTFDVPGGWPALFERNADVLWDPDLIIIGQQLDIDGNP